MLGPDEFRRALGHFATGVTIVTTWDDEARPTGLTASAMSSVSLDPPLVLVCVSHKSQSYPSFQAGRQFAVNVLASPILDDARAVIIDRLNRLHLPAIYQWPELAELGGFAGYGPRLAGVVHAAMQIVDKILRGVHPTDIPVQQPTKFELVINLKTAKALGLTIPPTVLFQADEVIR